MKEEDLIDNPRPVVLLAAGSNITTFALSRCFQNTGIPVVALDTDGAVRLLRSTRMIRKVHPLPDPVSDPEPSLRELLRYGRQLKGESGRRALLLPTEDSGLRFCADHFAEIRESFVLLGDPQEREISQLFDKGLFFSVFQGNEPYVPWTRACKDREQVHALKNELPYPVVLKPARKDPALSFQKRFGAKLVIARSFAVLSDIVESYFPADGIILQELIEHSEGEEVSWWGYRSRTGRITGMTTRQLRKHPRMGGTATVVRSEEIHELHKPAEKILERINFWGLCELEFISSESGYQLIECNPRPWLQIGLALRAGLNFPMLAYREIEGLSGPENGELEDGAPTGAKPLKKLYWMSPEYDLIRCFSAERGELLRNVGTWWRGLWRADEKGIWDMKEPRVILERLLSYPAKIRKNRSLFRAR